MSVQVIGGGSAPEANVPATIDAQITANNTTWYTMGNISGSGKLKRLSATAFSGTSNIAIHIRITVDGGTPTLIDPKNLGMTGSTASRGFGHSNTYSSAAFLDYILELSFTTSLLIEIMQDSGSSQSLGYSLDYSLL
jgi:hypothetical protein